MNARRIRSVMVCLALAAIVILSLAASPAGDPTAHAETDVAAATASEVETLRTAGSDRYGTAARVARHTFTAGETDTAIIVRGDEFADAVAANGLAGAVRAPVLLVRHDAVPDTTREALRDLGIERVILLGGTAAVSEAVESDLRAEHTVERIAGNDRYATAAEVARELDARAPLGRIDGARSAILVGGRAFPDALASGPLAYQEHLPVLLTPRRELSVDTAQVIDDLGIEHIVVVGGPAAVSADVVAELTDAGLTVERIHGANRVQTATRLASAMRQRWGFSASQPLLARGDAFPDALASGVLGGETAAPILLTLTPTRLTATTSRWLSARCPEVAAIHAVGGVSAVSGRVLVRAAHAAEACHRPPVRAAWIHLFDNRMKSASGVRDTVDEAADAGVNRLIVQVVRRHDAYYESDVLPRTPDPALPSGFDVLQATIDRAEQHGIAVEAWMSVAPAYHHAYDGLPHPPDWVWTLHGANAPVADRWVSRDYDGHWGQYLDPALSDVRRHVAAVVAEIAGNYDVDAVHLDYVRYESQPWGYHPRALSRFRSETGRTDRPAPNDAEWSAWRRTQVDRLIRTAATAVWAADPTVAVSAPTITWGEGPDAAGGFSRTRAYRHTFQNWPRWADREFVDAIYPMAYFRDHDPDQRSWFSDWTAFAGELDTDTAADVAVGIGAYLNYIDAMISQLEAAEAASSGAVVYSWQQPMHPDESRSEAIDRIRQLWTE